jgi:tetratricopeptide (TPR) repeat protein
LERCETRYRSGNMMIIADNFKPMFNWFQNKSKPEKALKVEGQLGYFNLADWWLSAFSLEEREYIEQVFQPLESQPDSRPLTQGKISYSSGTAVQLLSSLAGWFKKPKDNHIAQKILHKAEELGSSRILDLHFMYAQMVETYYRMRDTDAGALDMALVACKKQINIAPQALEEFKRQPPDNFIPAHIGYTQLAIVLEKQKKYAEAIELCQQAKLQGWCGDWDKRIERCLYRQSKQK